MMTVTYLNAKEINCRKKAVDITLSLDSDYWSNESEKVEAVERLIQSVTELTENHNIYWQVFETDGMWGRKIKIDGKYRFKH